MVRERENQIRIVGLEAITQATCENKIKTALAAKTTIDGRKLYHDGDQVDYYRKPARKDDATGWHGPVTVVRNIPEEGHVIVKIGNQEFPMSYPDVRHSLHTEVLALTSVQPHEALNVVLRYIAACDPGKLHTFGYQGAGTHLTR